MVAAVSFSGVVLVVQAAGGDRQPDLRGQLRPHAAQASVGFIVNRGQTAPAVAYYAPTFAGMTYVTRKSEIVHSLRVREGEASSRWTLTEKLVGRTRPPTGLQTSVARASYFTGNDPSQWQIGVETYGALALGTVWPGIEVFLRAREQSVEKIFVVAPAVPERSIRIRVSGARSLGVDENGRLFALTGRGRVSWSAPLAYQRIRGERHSVGVSYWIEGHEYGFRLAAHDRALPVMIDPLLQATYLGGSANDYAFAIAIHPKTGEVFVAGRTESVDFPGVSGGAQAGHSGGLDDVFVGRLNRDLTVLEQATYFGGSGIDFPIAIAIHPATEEVFVVGETGSTNLPGTAGAAQPRSGGGYDAFVARFSPTLTRLNQTTYLGGSGAEGAEAVAIDPATGDVFVAGWTNSTDLPRAAGGAQTGFGNAGRSPAGYDAFVARFNPALTVWKQSTYFGGSATDEATDIAIHPINGDVYLAGQTESRDLPGSAGGAQTAYAGIKDGFLARLDSSLTVLRQSTYLGGEEYDTAISMAIDPASGDIFAGGDTTSSDFPGLLGGARETTGGGFDGFLARLDSSLTRLTQSTYVGGGGIFVTALAIHPMTGEVFATGVTNLTNLPGTTGAAQPSYGGGVLDTFVVSFDPSLTVLNQATYLGGTDRETAWAIAIDPITGEVIVAGDTRSTNFPATAGGAQPAYGGGDLYGGDAFVARFTRDLAAGSLGSPSITPAPPRPSTTVLAPSVRPHPRQTDPR